MARKIYGIVGIYCIMITFSELHEVFPGDQSCQYGINFQQTAASHITSIPGDEAETVFDKEIFSILTQLIARKASLHSVTVKVKFYTRKVITTTLCGYGLTQLHCIQCISAYNIKGKMLQFHQFIYFYVSQTCL
jgi:hypothetical protein